MNSEPVLDAPPGPTTTPEPARPEPPSARRRAAQARVTIGGVIALQLLANGIGVAMVTAYLRIFLPVELGDRADSVSVELNLIVFGAYLGAMVLVALPVNALLLRRAVRWIRLGQRPSPREQRLVLNLPLVETLTALVIWVVAATIFGAINHTARIAVGIALAGLVTCTLLYLLLEAHFRPVFALALDHATLPVGRRDVLPRILLTWFIGSAIPLMAIGLLPLLAPASERFLQLRITVLMVIGLVTGGLALWVAARVVAERVNRVTSALVRIADGRLDGELTVDDPGELGRLAAGFNEMVAGLREREMIAELYGRQVGMDVTRTLSEANLSRRTEVTVLLVDLRGYTTFSETRPPEDVVAMLNRFFAVVVDVVRAEGGWVNKFEGDAALCVFGAPDHHSDHAARALRAASRLPGAVARLSELPASVAVATGEVLAGYVGTAERFEYTVIGDVVNVVARLCDASKDLASPVIVHGATIAAAGARHGWRHAETLVVRGRSEPVEVWIPHTGGRNLDHNSAAVV